MDNACTDEEHDASSHLPRTELSQSEINDILLKQSSRGLLSEFQITKLEKDAQKNWDIFYKRNETKFFKDRQWTLKEFDEIVSKCACTDNVEPVTLLEIGCGVGNFVFPLLQELSQLTPSLKMYACDFSTRAIEFLKSNPEYDKAKLRGFVADITKPNCFSSEELLAQEDGDSLSTELSFHKMDFLSLIFVLSSICPSKHVEVINNILSATKLNGVVFFRDYGRYDMAQLRFKPGKKIDENFYVRRDGTRSYYFTTKEVETLFTQSGHFEKLQCEYIHRRTINIKESINVERIFVQGKFIRKKL